MHLTAIDIKSCQEMKKAFDNEVRECRIEKRKGKNE